MTSFWRSVGEFVVEWPTPALFIGFFIGSFLCSSPAFPTRSWMNVIVSLIGATVYAGIFAGIKYLIRKSLAKKDKQ